MDLPKTHALRKALGDYKNRFEESLEELLDGTCFVVDCFHNFVLTPLSPRFHLIQLRLKGLRTLADLKDFQEEFAETVSCS